MWNPEGISCWPIPHRTSLTLFLCCCSSRSWGVGFPNRRACMCRRAIRAKRWRRSSKRSASAQACKEVEETVLFMNILYICHRLPYPPNKGEKIRAFYQLRYLATRHTIHLACLVDEAEDLQYVGALQQYCASIDMVYRPKIAAKLLALRALCTDQPLSVASFYSSALARKIRQRLAVEQIDRIVVFSSAMTVYVQQISGIPKIMDFVDADSEKWRLFADYHPWMLSWIYRLEAHRLARHEVEVARTFDHTIFVTDREAHILQEHVPERPISVIPNGVDLEY